MCYVWASDCLEEWASIAHERHSTSFMQSYTLHTSSSALAVLMLPQPNPNSLEIKKLNTKNWTISTYNTPKPRASNEQSSTKSFELIQKVQCIQIFKCVCHSHFVSRPFVLWHSVVVEHQLCVLVCSHTRTRTRTYMKHEAWSNNQNALSLFYIFMGNFQM